MSRLTKVALAALLLSPALASAEVPKVAFSGMVDSYFTLNLTHGQDYTSPTGGFTAPAGFNLNFAKLTTVAESGPATLRLDLGFGPEGQAITGFTPGSTNPGRLFVQQAFVALKFGRFTVDAGRFVTPCGFEVYESKDNWVYSRGLLFNFAMPIAHEGVRVSTALSPEITVAATLANGSDLWTNDVGFTQSPYKTGILGMTYGKDATSATANLYISKDPVTTEDAFLLDVVFTQGMGQWAFNLSGDYGKLGASAWMGLGGSVKYDLADDGLEIVGRVEFLDDQDGIHTGLLDPADLTGVTLFSLTGGLNYPVGSNAELRAELRLDRASAKVYGFADPSDSIATFSAAAIAWF